MKFSRFIHTPKAGFTLIEVIVAIMLGAIMGIIFITYDAGGNEAAVAGGGTSTNLKVTVHVQAGGYSLTSILTAERSTSGDQVTYF